MTTQPVPQKTQTATNTIVPAISQAQSPEELYIREIDPRMRKAIQALETGKIPKEQISTHPGKGGKTFKYVKHTHATLMMNAAFGQNWDWEVSNPQAFDDTSAMCLGKMTLHFPYVDAKGNVELHTRIITEVGAFQPISGGMPKAMAIGSAASRALLKCMFRAFGFGKELYPDTEDEVTPEAAWVLLANQAKKVGIDPKTELMGVFRKAGIIPEGALEGEAKKVFVDRFEELWKATSEAGTAKKLAQRNVPTIPTE